MQLRTLHLPKEVWIGWISSLAEAYNMAIYSFIAPLLAPFLFPQTSPWDGVFFSYSLIFLGSCIFYPIGAMYYGLLGDRLGRQKLCIFSTLGLAIATGLMGLIPLEGIKNGWLYFLLLIAAQHFFSGGEYHGSIVFSLEHSADKKKGFMSCLSCLFAVLGLIFAKSLATFAGMTHDLSWMRGCFFVGAISGFISYVLKNFCQETPAFCSVSQAPLKKTPWPIFIKEQWQTLSSVVLALAFFIVSYSFIFLFLPLVTPPANTSLFSFILYGVCLTFSGALADRIGVHRSLLMGICTFSAALLPLTYLTHNLLFLQTILTPLASLAIGPIHGWMLEQFEISQRCRGIFMSSAIATALFGGSTVPICLMIFEYTHSLVLCSVYPLLIGLITVGYLLSRIQFKKVFP